MLDQWKILKQVFLLKQVLTGEGESFTVRAQDFNIRSCLKEVWRGLVSRNKHDV